MGDATKIKWLAVRREAEVGYRHQKIGSDEETGVEIGMHNQGTVCGVISSQKTIVRAGS
jgi:hypothetical protein